MNKKIRRLVLHRETLQNIGDSSLGLAFGGTNSGQYGPTCPSLPPNCNATAIKCI